MAIALAPFAALASPPPWSNAGGNGVDIDSKVKNSLLVSGALTMDVTVGNDLTNSAATVGTSVDVGNALKSKLDINQAVVGSNLVSVAVVTPGIRLVEEEPDPFPFPVPADDSCTFCGIGIGVGELTVHDDLDNSAVTAGNVASLVPMQKVDINQVTRRSNLISVGVVTGAWVADDLTNTATSVGNSVSIGW